MENQLLSREQAAVSSFYNEFEWLRRMAQDDFEDRLVPVVDSFITAVAEFGLAEFNFRAAERRAALDIAGDETKLARERAQFHQDQGLRTLERSIEAVDRFVEDTGLYPKTRDLAEDLGLFQDNFRRTLIDLDIKASDVEKIDSAATKAIEVGRSGNVRELGSFFAAQLRKLREVRQSEDRGTAENIAFWKAVAIAIALGVSVWAIFKCSWTWTGRECKTAEGVAYTLAVKIAWLIAKLC